MMRIITIALCHLSISSALGVNAFNPSPSHRLHRDVVMSQSARHSRKRQTKATTYQHHRDKHTINHLFPLNTPSSISTTFGFDDTQTLTFWVFSFASSHIGMSAIRTSIISSLGEIANNTFKLVGNEAWALPTWWPGDNTGGNQIFPDELTAGRQFYRVLYTAISFLTLGMAFVAYSHCDTTLSSGGPMMYNAGDETTQSLVVYDACLYSAALSFGAAIASLFNASPLGLMPSFEKDASSSSQEENNKPINVAAARNDDDDDTITSIAGIRRDDTIKFTTRGLTRITRHPLILPVVPWGFATAYLAGGRPCDWILFGGLSCYAVVGCFAQDLRVSREEGSVGTVFQTESSRISQQQMLDLDEGEEERERLRLFFDETSFIPFKAVIDGRQSLEDVVKEFPWIQLLVGTLAGVVIEERILMLLREYV